MGQGASLGPKGSARRRASLWGVPEEGEAPMTHWGWHRIHHGREAHSLLYPLLQGGMEDCRAFAQKSDVAPAGWERGVQGAWSKVQGARSEGRGGQRGGRAAKRGLRSGAKSRREQPGLHDSRHHASLVRPSLSSPCVPIVQGACPVPLRRIGCAAPPPPPGAARVTAKQKGETRTHGHASVPPRLFVLAKAYKTILCRVSTDVNRWEEEGRRIVDRGSRLGGARSEEQGASSGERGEG